MGKRRETARCLPAGTPVTEPRCYACARMEQIARAVSSRVVVIATTPAVRSTAAALAGRLRLAYHDSPPPTAELILTQTETHLELRDRVSGARLCVRFDESELRRYRAGGAGGNPLRRAIGAGRRHVIDVTAGYGRDAVHLVALGYRVTAIERNDIVSALAQDAFARAHAQRLLDADNPRWLSGDARALLSQLDASASTIYLDPMFPPKRKKSAAVRKEMSLLRRLAVDDTDAEELLTVARRHAADRVVVKRPIDAPPLATGVAAAYRGKLVRYDVYRATGSP
jgi:16S rRNA (guanine1516-N2)-methyltransferase